jgi:DNA-binding Lrp family transcriptional regulator
MVELDDIEIKILRELQKNARLSFKELSMRTGISKSTIYRKVKKMEEMGIIRRYTVSLDQTIFKNNVLAFVLIKIDPNKIDSTAKKLREFREILGVYRITGHYNILVKVATSDINALNELIKRFHELGAKETVTNIVLEKFFDEGIELTEDSLIF